jgi:HEAT repeat protein
MMLGRTGVVAIALGAMAMLSPRAAIGRKPAPPPPPAPAQAADAGATDGGAPDAGSAVPGMTGAELDALVAPLRRIAADPRASDEERCRAAFALAQQVGPGAVADLEPLLQDPRASLRLGAARGLGQAGGDDAKKALEDRLELEETPVVREAIQRTLTLMQP